MGWRRESIPPCLILVFKDESKHWGKFFLVAISFGRVKAPSPKTGPRTNAGVPNVGVDP